MTKLYWLLSTMSPPQVLPWRSNGGVSARCVFDGCAAMAMRISPKRGSPCAAPLVPSACPPSGTTLMLMLALTDQAWKARRISASQFAVGVLPFKVCKRLLALPLTLVPSGAKLSVRWPGLGQAMPHCEGVSRSSRRSRKSLRDLVRIADSHKILQNLFVTVPEQTNQPIVAGRSISRALPALRGAPG